MEQNQSNYTPVDIYLFFPIMVSVLPYISPIYHAVSLLPNPSPHKCTIDPSHCSDICNPLSDDQILQMGVQMAM